jgi:CRP-like cAMP-binding protein
MLNPLKFDPSAEPQTLQAGLFLLRRGALARTTLHLESGRVALGVAEGDELSHQLGVVEGPFWLNATDAILNLPNVMDAVAETEVVIRAVPVPAFRSGLSDLSSSMRAVVNDLAAAHRQQTELAVSRMAKDAEARCAEWLLRHAKSGEQGSMAVMLHEHKWLIAQQLGIAPETLSRVLRHLRELSLISCSGRVVKLLDPGRLRSLAGT